MALETIPQNLGQGLAHINNQTLRAILVELQGLKFTVVAGAGADTNIAIAGIKTVDTLLFVLALDPDNGTPADQVVDQTANTSITSDGNIQCTNDTTGYDVVVVYRDKKV